jgi:hypothetical protein
MGMERMDVDLEGLIRVLLCLGYTLHTPIEVWCPMVNMIVWVPVNEDPQAFLRLSTIPLLAYRSMHTHGWEQTACTASLLFTICVPSRVAGTMVQCVNGWFEHMKKKVEAWF